MQEESEMRDTERPPAPPIITAADIRSMGRELSELTKGLPRLPDELLARESIYEERADSMP